MVRLFVYLLTLWIFLQISVCLTMSRSTQRVWSRSTRDAHSSMAPDPTSDVLIGISLGLKCWHCISKDCDLDPSENYKAVKKQCSPGQYCQKVYYSMYSTMDNRIYDSTVRGCAWNCLPKNDFENCSSELHGSRGCVTKNCCRDSDLCNTGSRVVTSSNILYLIIAVLSMCYVT